MATTKKSKNLDVMVSYPSHLLTQQHQQDVPRTSPKVIGRHRGCYQTKAIGKIDPLLGKKRVFPSEVLKKAPDRRDESPDK